LTGGVIRWRFANAISLASQMALHSGRIVEVFRGRWSFRGRPNRDMAGDTPDS